MNDLRRFWRKFTPMPNGCWYWDGALKAGYGRFSLNGRTEQAHRAAYLLFVGDLPERHEVHHSCEAPLCVNPAHLVALPIQGRPHRAIHTSAMTHHACGCQITEANTYIAPNGSRACRRHRTLAAHAAHARAGRRKPKAA